VISRKASATSPPWPLSTEHEYEDFHSGELSLDSWLVRRAYPNQISGASRTFVICDKGQHVIGYYSLSAASISHALATSSVRRNMPEPVPMLLLGRLAVAVNWHGKGMGSGLLKDAVLRTFQVSRDIGIRGMLVHAVSDAAKQFYLRWDFVESPVDPLTLMARLTDLERTLQALPG
jgi:GNAT superfamily N-acetyltransferase